MERPNGNFSIDDMLQKARGSSPIPEHAAPLSEAPIQETPTSNAPDTSGVTQIPKVEPSDEERKLFDNKLPGAGRVVARRFANYNATPNTRGTSPIRIRNS